MAAVPRESNGPEIRRRFQAGQVYLKMADGSRNESVSK
jgi:hypothetical protein